jgi:hypothetical protein
VYRVCVEEARRESIKEIEKKAVDMSEKELFNKNKVKTQI